MNFKECLAYCLMAMAFAQMGKGTAFAETRALLIGVSQYDSPEITDLAGPANDLVAMETLVRKLGATDIVVLKDDEATRSSVETALYRIGQRANPDDWLILYYSGHGAQAAATIATSKDGNFNQFLPLTGFDLKAQNYDHFIVDKDFYNWLKNYVPSNVRIYMMVDSCHSGSMHRRVNNGLFGFTARNTLNGQGSVLNLIPRPGLRYTSAAINTAEADDDISRDDLPNLIYIGASQDGQLALETELPRPGDLSRGVLSFAFEQGLSTSGTDDTTTVADLDSDGIITVAEISSYLNSQVRLLSANRQDSTSYFASPWSDTQIFSVSPSPDRVNAITSASVSIQAGRDEVPPLPDGWPWRISSQELDADFLWIVANGWVMRRSGDFVAENIKSFDALSGVIEKWQTVETLIPLVSERNFRIEVEPDGIDYLYQPEMEMKINLRRTSVNKGRPSYLTIFNLASDGTLQMLYPLGDETGLLRSEEKQLMVIETQVIAPFGVDHIIAVATPDNASNLRATLRTANGQRASARLLDPINRELKRAKGQASILISTIYTGEY